MAVTSREEKIDHILDAAVDQFSQLGYAKTSMATIAAAAGVSRPALYQFFENREDVFRSVLKRIYRSANQEALAALESDDPLGRRLDGFLQRRHGDIVELVVNMPYGAEIIEAHLSVAPDIGEAANAEARAALVKVLRRDHGRAVVDQVADLLQFAPYGMKSDHPDMTTYRRRLSTLASAAAAMLEERNQRLAHSS